MDRSIEFFFDVSSPYSYLCATQIEAIAEKHGVSVVWRPFLLGGVFKAAGNDMPARVPLKARWMLSDLALWAKHYGVPFTFPVLFPANTLRTMRACIAAGAKGKAREAAMSFFEGYWVRGEDPASDAALQRAAEASGIDYAELAAAADTKDVKDALRASTEEAVARGAFGAPTMFFGDTMLWGNDRLPMLGFLLEQDARARA